VKFLIDMPLPPSFALWLRGQGHDAEHALAVGLDRAPDTEIIARAATERRTVVTADLDYPRLLALSRAIEPSLVLFRGADWTETYFGVWIPRKSNRAFWWSIQIASGADGCRSDRPCRAAV
jgi:predicted nuclease of predicted toxin-antitoxin system